MAYLLVSSFHKLCSYAGLSYCLFGPWLLVTQPGIKAGKFLVSFLVKVSFLGILFSNLPGKVSTIAFQKNWTSCLLVGSW
jgi:hypothetical protein